MDALSHLDDGLDSALLRARVVIVAMGAAVIAYAVIGGPVTAPDSYDPPIGDDTTTRWVLRAALAAVAFINLSTAVYIRRAIIERGGDGEGERAPLAARLFVSTKIAGAFVEAVGVYGLVLTLIGGRLWDVVAFGGVAALGLALLYPTRAKWTERARLEAMRGARLAFRFSSSFSYNPSASGQPGSM